MLRTLRLRSSSWSTGDFDGLSRTLRFTGKALDAVFLSCWIRLLLRSRMPRCFRPFENCYRTNLETNTVTCTDVPVYRNIRSVYAKFLRRLNWTPNIVTLMLTYDFAAFFEVWVYWHHNSPITEKHVDENINLSHFLLDEVFQSAS